MEKVKDLSQIEKEEEEEEKEKMGIFTETLKKQEEGEKGLEGGEEIEEKKGRGELEYYLIDSENILNYSKKSSFFIEQLRKSSQNNSPNIDPPSFFTENEEKEEFHQPIVLSSDKKLFKWDVQSRYYSQETRALRVSQMAYQKIQKKLPFGERTAIMRDPHFMNSFYKISNFSCPFFSFPPKTENPSQKENQEKNNNEKQDPSPLSFQLPSISKLPVNHFLPETFFLGNSFPPLPFPSFSKRKVDPQIPTSFKKRRLDILDENQDVFISNVEHSITRFLLF